MGAVNVGDKFGSLTVKGFENRLRRSGKPKTLALCECECGENAEVEKGNLTSGNTTRCLKCKSKIVSKSRRTHGHTWANQSATKLEKKCYYTWQAMRRRCSNPNDKRYADYGGRGITVSAEWDASYESFNKDMGLPPTMDHQIDRIDNEKGYSPDNCHWVTRTENNRNRRNNIKVFYSGRDWLLHEIAELTGANESTVKARIFRHKWPLDDVFRGYQNRYRTPKGCFTTLKEVQEAHNLSSSGAHGRFKSKNYPEWCFI